MRQILTAILGNQNNVLNSDASDFSLILFDYIQVEELQIKRIEIWA